jgi:hypothetical protein
MDCPQNSSRTQGLPEYCFRGMGISPRSIWDRAELIAADVAGLSGLWRVDLRFF